MEFDTRESVELTGVQEGFIGKQFTNGVTDGVLTVASKLKEGSKYLCSCSICSEDKDMFPYGSISMTKDSLERGGLPCGCNIRYRYNERQTLLMAERMCMARDYILHGVSSRRSPNGNLKTFIDITCKLTDGRKKEMPLANFRMGRDIQQRSSLLKTGVPLLTEIDQVHNLKEKFPNYRNLKMKREPDNTWVITCPVCSTDTMSGLDITHSAFRTDVIRLRAGVSICRCNRALNKEEQTTLIKATLIKEGATFISWSGIIIGNNEQYSYVCKGGHSCNSTYGNFAQGKRCKLCANIETGNRYRADTDYWQDIVNNNVLYAEGTKVQVVLDGTRKLDYFCPVCAEDPIAKAGLCQGKFKVQNHLLHNGCRPCRCSKHTYLPQAHQEFLISTKMKGTGKSFVEWVGEYINNDSRLLLSCKEGNNHEISASNYKLNGYRCYCCDGRSYGFDGTKSASLYINHCVSYDKEGFKMGITNRSVELRHNEQKNSSDLLKYDTVHVFNFEVGEDALVLERRLKSKYPRFFFSKEELPDGYTETFDIKYLPSMLKDIESFRKDLGL